MFKGVVYALGACLIWGLIFVIPEHMGDYSPLEIAVGRYLVFGSLSLGLFLASLLRGQAITCPKIWGKAALYSFASTVWYYTFLVLGLRYCTPAICALIMGLCPILIAFYGNFTSRDISYKKLMLPSSAIILGLLAINIPHMQAAKAMSVHLSGLGFCMLSLISWVWYVVANAKFLRKHPEVKIGEWTTLLGLTTLLWAIALLLTLLLFVPGHLKLDWLHLAPGTSPFICGSLILGLLCSWVGAFLWNRACLSLPIFLAGQLTIFETVFGAFFVYLIAREFPSKLESGGIVLLILAILYAMRLFAKEQKSEQVLH